MCAGGCNGGRATPHRHSAPQTPQSATASIAAVEAGSQVWHEIWRGGRYTGRRSSSLVSAQQIAARMGGEVRTA